MNFKPNFEQALYLYYKFDSNPVRLSRCHDFNEIWHGSISSNKF